MISLAALILACLVGVGVLFAFYGSRRIPIPGPAELRTNLRQADRVLALQFPSDDGIFKRMRCWLDAGGFHDVATGEYVAVCVGNVIAIFILVRLLLGGDILAVEIGLASLVVPIGYVTMSQRGREEAIEEQLDKVLSILINLLQASGRNLRSALGELVEEEMRDGTKKLRCVLPVPL
ncbi:MAG: hypothetical protein M1358_20290, partial [Chloroflexi bacterium]|nr:hypothetical protein [Chloroflexota bacterium]